MLLRRRSTAAKISEPEYAVVSDIKCSNSAEYKMDVNSCYAMAQVQGKTTNVYEEVEVSTKE